MWDANFYYIPRFLEIIKKKKRLNGKTKNMKIYFTKEENKPEKYLRAW